MSARIYQPAKTAMQSGMAGTRFWILEYIPQKVELKFATSAEAIAYAERNGIAYRICKPSQRKHITKSYADNFRYDRVGVWTH